MEDHRRSPEEALADGTPDAGPAFDKASSFLQRLIPLPGSGSVAPLSLLPIPVRPGAAPSNTVAGTDTGAGEPAAQIVAQAASVLDEEMAKGLLSARRNGGTVSKGDSPAGHPLLSQMHHFVDNLAALWPNLQAGAVKGPPSSSSPYPLQRTSGGSAPLPTLKPHAPVRPGERVTISMTLRNSEHRPVHLVPAATDLIGSQGGRISSSLLEFAPPQIALEPGQQNDLVISATVPLEAAPGCYSGLLVVAGLDYLRALVAIDVAGTATAARPAPTETPAALRHKDVMHEAIRLAADGELGNSDAIRLLQMPHSADDIKQILGRFDKQLTREAKSKLVLDAFVPLPNGVVNQRYEPIFDRYPLTGKTYTTRSGAVVLNEVQYYNGEMVQLHGGCTNIAGVREALAGSGFKPMTLRQANGQESAIVQFWAHQLTDTSLRPYNAMFVILAVVPEGTPESQACIRADDSGASAALSMFDGSFDPSRRCYENRARLYFARLLDSTQVAIDVGRERMGTDKRPGTIELRHEGPQCTFSVSDGGGHAVARIRFVPTEDASAYVPQLARAAATARIPLPELPQGTEYVYPALARIAHGPIVQWQWRTDVTPRFQPVKPDTVSFDAASELGAMLIRWGFEPKVLGYIRNVRGVVTGIADKLS